MRPTKRLFVPVPVQGIAAFFSRKIIIFFLLLLANTILAANAAQPTGCQICASTGQCNAAFHNGPGQYCGSWYDMSSSSNKPCCCPLQSTCSVSPTQCKCHIDDVHPSGTTRNFYPSNQGTTSHHNDYYEKEESSIWPGVLIFISICFCCMCCRNSRNKNNDRNHPTHHEHVPVATAVHAYASCPPENPAYTTDYGSTTVGDKPTHGGGGAGTAIASGLGGLVAGTIIGDLIGRNTTQGNNVQGFRGDQMYQGSSGGGGYDITGDSGDGGGNVILGDSGDYGTVGGYDIQGDS